MKNLNRYKHWYFWNLDVFPNSNQISEVLKIDRFKERKKKHFWVLKNFDRENEFLTIACPIYNIFELCKLFSYRFYQYPYQYSFRCLIFTFTSDFLKNFIFKSNLREPFFIFFKLCIQIPSRINVASVKWF